MKAVVLAGGQGTRLRPITYSVPKQLIPIGGRPVLSHVLSDIASCGISDAVVITSPESQQPVQELLSTNDHGLNTTVVLQESPDGLAAAYSLALPHIGKESSLLYLGDCLLTGGVSHVVHEHEESGAEVTILVKEVDEPSRYGIVEVDSDGFVRSLVEKPVKPRSNQAIVGVYALGPSIHEAVNAINPSARGEYEITDAIQYLVVRGATVRSSSVRGWWIDTGTVPDVLSAHQRVMSDAPEKIEGQVINTERVGTATILGNSRVRNSRIEGPVIMDSQVSVHDSFVGPYSHLAEGVVVANAEVRNSIVMEGARLIDVSVDNSIVGPGATILGDGLHNRLEVVLGADAYVSLASSQEG